MNYINTSSNRNDAVTSRPKSLLVVYNPVAGWRRPGLLEQVVAALEAAGAQVVIRRTETRGDAERFARQARDEGYDRLLVAGGDGTINEVVNGIKGAEASTGRRAQLGIIPLGTGSDFIKVLGGVEPNDIAGGVRRALSPQARPVDLGRVQVGDDEPRYFINALGMGFDAQAAAESLKLTKLKGLAVYLVAIIRALANYKAHPMQVDYDGERMHRRLLFASVANGRCQGGGFWLTPDAQIDDGLLDLCLVDNLRLDQIIRYLPKVMEGSHTALRQVTMARAQRITATCNASMPVATDGEVIATHAQQVTVETLPGAIEVLV